MNLIKLLALFYLSIGPIFSAEKFVIGLEEAPPLIQRDGKGVLNLILEEIEKKTPYDFTYEYVSYGRAIKMLKSGAVDLIGMTPVGLETDEFYKFAVDVDFNFKTHNYLFTRNELRNYESLNEFKLLGTLPGNEDFIAEAYGLKKSQFIVGSFEALFKMLEKDRIQGVIFEAITTHYFIRKNNIKDIYSRVAGDVIAGFSMNKKSKKFEIINKAFRDAKIVKLKKSLEELSLKRVNKGNH